MWYHPARRCGGLRCFNVVKRLVFEFECPQSPKWASNQKEGWWNTKSGHDYKILPCLCDLKQNTELWSALGKMYWSLHLSRKKSRNFSSFIIHVSETLTKEHLQNLSYINNMISQITHNCFKKKKPKKKIKYCAGIRKSKTKQLLHLCMWAWVYSEERKNKRSDEKGEEGGGGVKKARGCSPGTMSPTC